MYTIIWREGSNDKWDRLVTMEEVKDLIRKLKNNPEVSVGDVWIFTPGADDHAITGDQIAAQIEQ